MNTSTSLRRAKAPLALTAAVILAASACGGDGGNSGDNGSGGGDQLSGSVKIDGSSTVAPLTSAASEFYAEEQPKVKVTVGTSGTGGGFKKFCVGETDISDASRPIKDEEIKTCEENGVTYEQFAVANDALSVVVHKDNDWVDCLTTDQLKKIWEPDSKVKSWKEVDPKFPDEPLKLFGPGTDSGTFDYFTDEINGEEGASRTDYSASEDDNVLVTGVSGSKGGLGYFGFSYYEENKDKLKLLDVDGGEGCVKPSVATTQDGSYKPLGRQLFIYPSAKSLKRPEVVDFVEFYVENHKEIAEDAQFIPLNDKQEEELKAALDKLKAASK
ncbi:PstS family phosphate ABC transporter substrate-binding protein [Streptomyces sp. TRM66268-LWL]|uniref:Phosphate-binding protein n=1 Tax=Streptomyces polyasparticus TaxID=2767826 RepID=A0ABR7S7S2_9ACTN|nr:PstS family phosphate ABC transporter substrate-binding protein [Streptomyces polyasparticus]MBC9711468.1 PstS family phosphate ABC transporter substrate-binding protein [Streptomyces polyasparticus]